MPWDESKFVKFSNDDPWLHYVANQPRNRECYTNKHGCRIFQYYYGVNNLMKNEEGITVEITLEDNLFAKRKKYEITCIVPQFLSIHADGISVIGAPKGKRSISTSYIKSMTLVPGLEQFIFHFFFCVFAFYTFLYQYRLPRQP